MERTETRQLYGSEPIDAAPDIAPLIGGIEDVQIAEERQLLYEKAGVFSDYQILIETSFLALEGRDTREELAPGHDWADRSDLIRLVVQNLESRGKYGGWWSWGDLQEFFFVTNDVGPNRANPDISLVANVGVGPTGRGIDNCVRVYPGAGVVGVDLSERKINLAAVSLRARGHTVHEMVVDPQQPETLEKAVAKADDIQGTGEILLVTGEASMVLSQMPRKFDRLVAQMLCQHLPKEPPPWWDRFRQELIEQGKDPGPFPTFSIVGKVEHDCLKNGGEAIFTDLTLGGDDGWFVRTEDSETQRIHNEYLYGHGQFPGALALGWGNRKATVFKSADHLAKLVRKYTGLEPIPESITHCDSGEITIPNHPNTVIGVQMMPTIRSGVEMGRERMARIEAVFNLGLSSYIKELSDYSQELATRGSEYIERVFLSPAEADTKVNMPGYVGVKAKRVD